MRRRNDCSLNQSFPVLWRNLVSTGIYKRLHRLLIRTRTFLVPNCQFYVWKTQATKLIYVQYRNITVDQNTPLNCACFQRWSVTTHSLFKTWDWILPVRTSITDKMNWLNLQRCRDKAKHFHKKYPLAVYWRMTEKFWVIFIFYFLNFILCILPTKLYLTQRATYLSQEYCEESN